MGHQAICPRSDHVAWWWQPCLGYCALQHWGQRCFCQRLRVSNFELEKREVREVRNSERPATAKWLDLEVWEIHACKCDEQRGSSHILAAFLQCYLRGISRFCLVVTCWYGSGHLGPHWRPCWHNYSHSILHHSADMWQGLVLSCALSEVLSAVVRFSPAPWPFLISIAKCWTFHLPGADISRSNWQGSSIRPPCRFFILPYIHSKHPPVDLVLNASTQRVTKWNLLTYIYIYIYFRSRMTFHQFPFRLQLQANIALLQSTKKNTYQLLHPVSSFWDHKVTHIFPSPFTCPLLEATSLSLTVLVSSWCIWSLAWWALCASHWCFWECGPKDQRCVSRGEAFDVFCWQWVMWCVFFWEGARLITWQTPFRSSWWKHSGGTCLY